jgi:hypothetical protein
VVVSDQSPGRALAARVTEINPLDMDAAPRALSDRGILPTRQDDDGSSATPLRTLYQVRLEMENAELAAAPLGGTVRAAVHVAPQSIATRLRRFLAKTFRAQSE